MTNEEAMKQLLKMVLRVGSNPKDHEAIALGIGALANEPKKGNWLEQNPFRICNQCGKGYHKDFHKRYNFCPNCGADMRETDND